jgi:hypothetical protein
MDLDIEDIERELAALGWIQRLGSNQTLSEKDIQAKN